MKTYSVRTDRGTLKVKGNLNSEGMVTGRVDGVTYKGKTWDDVERQIKKAHRGYPPMEKYLAVQFLRVGYEFFGSDVEVVTKPEDTYGFSVSYGVVLVSEECPGKDCVGRWIQDKDDGSPRFVRTDGEDVSRILEYDDKRLVKWSQEIQDELDNIIMRSRELAGAIDNLLDVDDLPQLTGARAMKALLSDG